MSEAYHHDTPKASKEHSCVECLGAIRKGETYHYHHGVYDGSGFTEKQCNECCALMHEINLQVWKQYGPGEESIPFGSLTDTVFDPVRTQWNPHHMQRFLVNADARGGTVAPWMRERYAEAMTEIGAFLNEPSRARAIIDRARKEAE